MWPVIRHGLHPGGYRKAMRLMRPCDRFRLPILSLSILPAPMRGVGRGAGQGEAMRLIAGDVSPAGSGSRHLIGEGGSGGALGIGVADRLLMLSTVSTPWPSPEACASIFVERCLQAAGSGGALENQPPPTCFSSGSSIWCCRNPPEATPVTTVQGGQHPALRPC